MGCDPFLSLSFTAGDLIKFIMRLKKPVLYVLLALCLFAVAYVPTSTNAQKESILMQVVVKRLEKLHYQPATINDEFSKKVYDLYLKRLDYGHRYFTESDLQQLQAFQYSIDDEINAGTFEFFNLSLQLLESALVKTQGFYQEILAEPFDFERAEGFQLDPEKQEVAKNDEELKALWRKFMKYETLTRFYDKYEEQKEAGEEKEHKSEEELELEARQEVLEMMDSFYKRLGKLKREERLSNFLNAVTGLFDPHTTYMLPFDKEQFNFRFSGRLEGIGARLQTDGDYTKVSSIVVGGPAWQGKELEDNDIILKVAQGEEEAVDIKGMVINDVVQLIRGDKGTEVRLTVKKVDGTTKIISIIRDIVLVDERFAKSLILDGEKEGERVGYIYLPGFYADFENPDGRFSAKDIKVELEKLKSENVDGVILDLRNNGGGSLLDVVKISGYFIEEGPIVQVKSRRAIPEVKRDRDPSVLYDGPLIILVNQNSASASEILVAAMQDYGRAVIVGSKSTFGKGTVQRFIPLDRTLSGYEEIKPLGDLKLTTQKFYRINGGSNQLKGVEPDIVLPNAYHFIDTGEKKEDYPMAWSEIDPVEYKQDVARIKDIEKLRAKSAKRVAANPVFQKIYANAKRLKTQREETIMPLNLETFSNYEKGRTEDAEAYKDIFDEIVNSGIKNLEIDLPGIHNDVSKEARNEDWIKSVSKDVYIQETIKIMHDLIEE